MEEQSTLLEVKGRHTQEETEAEVTSHGIGSRNATLQLSRAHTEVKPFDLQDEEEELLSALKHRKREFTFTGYDIMADVGDPAEGATDVAEVDPEEERRKEHARIYERSCRLLGIQPIHSVAERLGSRHVALRARNLGVKGVTAVAIAILNNRTAGSLDLQDNWMGPDGAMGIAQLLGFSKSLTDVNISENRIGTAGIRAIAEILNTNDTLQKLDVSGSSLFDDDAKYVAMILENNYKLRELRVCHNQFADLGGQYLGPAIASNDTLELLDLSWNHLRGKGAMAVAAGLQANTGLKTLDLSFNGFAADSCPVLGAALRHNATLRDLNLAHNRLGTEAVGHVLKGLQLNGTLSAIKLGNNPIRPEIATVIMRTIGTAANSAIRFLDLSNIVVQEEFFTLLEETKKLRFIAVETGAVFRRIKGPSKEGERIHYKDPVQTLKDYMTDKLYRITDLFRCNMGGKASLTRSQFTNGLTRAQVLLTGRQVDALLNQLDPDMSDIVDLRLLEQLIHGNTLHEDSSEDSMP